MKKNIKKYLTMVVAAILLCVVLCSCSTCERACKDYQSDVGGGLYRTVKVYDIEGDLVAEYTGKFDIETDHDTYILWDDEMGKRHIIYFSTFNIIIDEK